MKDMLNSDRKKERELEEIRPIVWVTCFLATPAGQNCTRNCYPTPPPGYVCVSGCTCVTSCANDNARFGFLLGCVYALTGGSPLGEGPSSSGGSSGSGSSSSSLEQGYQDALNQFQGLGEKVEMPGETEFVPAQSSPATAGSP